MKLSKIEGHPANLHGSIKIENCQSAFHTDQSMGPKYDTNSRHRHHIKLRKNEIIHSCFTMINGQHCSNLDGLIAKTCPVVPAFIGEYTKLKVTLN